MDENDLLDVIWTYQIIDQQLASGYSSQGGQLSARRPATSRSPLTCKQVQRLYRDASS